MSLVPRIKTFPSTSISGKAAPILLGDRGEEEIEKREGGIEDSQGKKAQEKRGVALNFLLCVTWSLHLLSENPHI